MQANQLKTGVILTYLTMFLRIFFSLFFTPIILNLLGQNEFGLYQLVISVVAYLSLLSFGLSSSYVRYYSKFKMASDEEGVARLNGMFTLIYCVIALLVLFFGSILVLNVQNIFGASLTPSELSLAKVLMIILVANMALSFPMTVFSGYIYANERYTFQKILDLLSVIASPMLSILVLILGYRSIGLVSVTVGLNIAIQIAYVIYCYKKLNIKFHFRGFDFSLFKELFVFSSFIFINIIVDKINWNVDKFLLGIYQGTAAIAVYSIAAQLNTYYLTFSTAIASVLAPRVNQLAFQENADVKLNELFVRIGRLQFIILSLVLSGLIIFGRAFILLWIGEEYIQAYTIVLILVIPVTIPLVQTLGPEIQRAKNLHRFRAIAYLIIAIVNVLISIPLTKMYSGVGSAIGTAFALIVGNGLIMNIYYHKKCGLNIIRFWQEMAKFIPSLILPVICGFIIINFIHIDTWLSLITYIGLYTILFIINLWVCSFNRYEKDLFLNLLRKIFSKL